MVELSLLNNHLHNLTQPYACQKKYKHPNSPCYQAEDHNLILSLLTYRPWCIQYNSYGFLQITVVLYNTCNTTGVCRSQFICFAMLIAEGL